MTDHVPDNCAADAACLVWRIQPLLWITENSSSVIALLRLYLRVCLKEICLLFQRTALLPNKPCLISAELTDNWPCFSAWTRQIRSVGIVDGSQDSGMESKIDWSYLRKVYGHQNVAVADCLTREFSDQRRVEVTLSEAIDILLETNSTDLGDEHPGTPPHETPSAPVQIALPYVKDWHLVLQSHDLAARDDQMPYLVPPLFADDCEYPLISIDDCRTRFPHPQGTRQTSILILISR